MNTMRYLSSLLLPVWVAFCMHFIGCARYVDKDSETSVGIIGQQPGGQVIVDGGTGGNGGSGGNGGGDGGTGGNGGSGGNEEPMDCSGGVVKAKPGSYDDFAVWMSLNSNRAQTQDTVKLVASSAGYYELYVLPWGSGADEPNESFYATVKNAENTAGYPVNTPNCDNFYIVKDNDNIAGPASDEKTYIGTFFLTKGDNTLTIHHYCSYFNQNRNKSGFMRSECASFHKGYTSSNSSSWPSSAYAAGGCVSCDTNSVIINPSGICIKPDNTWMVSP